MQSFIHLSSLEQLQEKDFSVFYPAFKRAIEKKIPVFTDLIFIHNADQTLNRLNSKTAVEKIENFFTTKQDDQQFFCVIDENIILTLPGEKDVTLAVIAGVDSYMARKISLDWLKDLADDLVYQFLLIKKAGTNLATGFYNDKQFYATIDYLVGHGNVSVLLVEVFPQARTAIDAKLHTGRAVRTLQGYIEDRLPLFYLGNHLFGIISANRQPENFRNFCQKLFFALRREGFRKVHLGLDCIENGDVSNKITSTSYKIVDNAFAALQTANKRGPFSLCDFEHLRYPERHPLRRPGKSILGRLRNRWKTIDAFSLVQLEPQQPDDFRRLAKIFEQDIVITDYVDFYILLPDSAPQVSLSFIQEKITAAGIDNVKLGVGYYPHITFTKSNVVFNCKRALRHASFFGPAGTAIVDEVSFNVSGDIYYAEGDIRSAIKEYKIGLRCDQDNINLLNSLGVAYADIAQNHRAKGCFARVLDLDSENFMALYNYGLGAEQKEHTETALDYFERAFAVSSDYPEIKDDLHFHLGKLYTVTGRYEKAIEILQILQQNGSDAKLKGRSLTYLGQAYYGCAKKSEAMTWLQRALKYNEYDADSMGLLGLLYHENGEGDDIALTLCLKSVELDYGNRSLKLYLAETQMACGDYASARATLNKCLRAKTTKVEATLLMIRCYLKEKSPKRAAYWLEKIRGSNNLHEGVWEQISILQEELNEI